MSDSVVAPVELNAADESLRRQLEQFVYDNQDLERLEAILDNFNPFVALRWTRQEMRHSAFLRWLLDPTETHGLGAYFLTAFWKRVARLAPGTPSVVEIDAWDMSRAVVLQEWHSIDVLVQDDVNQFVGVIENKTDSTEHGEQLQRYRSDVERHFAGRAKRFVYLTPEGDAPSDNGYVVVRYADVVDLLKGTLERRRDQLADEVRAFIEQYVEMVERYIMEESEIQALCRRIYQKHQRALEVLFENRPDRTWEVTGILTQLVQARTELIPDHCTRAYVRFISKNLDFIPPRGEGWTPTKRMLLFEVRNYGGEVRFAVVLGPGDQSVRQKLHGVIRNHPKLFDADTKTLYPKYLTCHNEKWLGKKQYEELDPDALRQVLGEHLERFIKERLPQIEAAFSSVQGTFER